MKYSCECVINLPREQVLKLFDDPDNLTKWQPSLKNFEMTQGELGAVGSQVRLVYEERGRDMVMVETITSRNLPNEMSMTYDASGMKNWITNHFYEEDGKTRWVMESEFQFTNLMMKLFGFFMRAKFPQETQKSMNMFKEFAESVEVPV